MRKRKADISIQLSGLAAVLIVFAVIRWLINRLYLSRAKKSLFG